MVKQRLRNSDFGKVFGHFWHRDFSGDAGQGLKNSTYLLLTNIISKAGSFVLSIVMARLLLPDLFGLYSLALSTILFFAVFSELGAGTALLTFVSTSLGNNDNSSAKMYYLFLRRHKLYLTLFACILLASLAYYISFSFYDKPIFYALLAGILYILANGILGIFVSTFHSENNFRITMIKEIIIQVSRFILIPLAILYSFSLGYSVSTTITLIIIASAVCLFWAVAFLAYFPAGFSFMNARTRLLRPTERKELYRFMYPLAFIGVSGLFFGYIDTFMLGHYVDASFIALYGVAFGIIGALSGLLSTVPGALLPILSRRSTLASDTLFRRARNLLVLCSLTLLLLTILLGRYVLYLYGDAYLGALFFLYLLSPLLVFLPLNGMYHSYFTAQRRTFFLATLLVISTILNIVLNYFFIRYGLLYSMNFAVVGACLATLLSKAFYSVSLVLGRRKFLSRLFS